MKEHHWSDTVHNLVIAGCQIAITVYVISQYSDWSFDQWLRGLPSEFRKWRQAQEFEVYYRYVWPARRMYLNEHSVSAE